MHVVGVIDRYLEHARIFQFCAAGEDKMFIGSADWMPRNLNSRVEVVTPVYDPDIKRELATIISYALRDNMQGRVVDGTDRNLAWQAGGSLPFRSQEALYNHYLEEAKSSENISADTPA